MDTALWTRVDDYLRTTLDLAGSSFDAALAASRNGGLPDIQVTPTQGRLLEILARMLGARAILEIGTLGGYSTLWLARGLAPGGRIVTLEAEPKHAEVAHATFRSAGIADRVSLRLGKASQTLPALVAEAPFDLIFVDADKPSLPEYFQWSLKLARPGSLIVVDNVVREGEVADAASADASVRGVRRMNELIAAEPRVIGTALQTVGAKGYDGIAFVFVTR